MINSQQFAKAYSERYGVPYEFAIHECKKFWELLGRFLYEDKADITIYGFGSFKQRIMNERNVMHPVSKEIITIPKCSRIKFIQTSSES